MAAGWLIAAYQVGYGLAAFGGGALQNAISLSTVFRLTAVLVVVMGLLAIPIARRQHPQSADRHVGRARRVLNSVPRLEGATMPEHYDVIIIGTGAGGGTLAHALAPSGKRILLLERGDFLPREMDNWNPDAVFIDGRYISPDTWYDADGKAFQPQVHYYVGRSHEALRRRALPPAPGGLRRDRPRRRHLAGVAASGTTTSSPGTRRPSGSTRSTATAARTRPRARPRSPIRGRR